MATSDNASRHLTTAAKQEVLRRFGGRCALCLAEAHSGLLAFHPPRTMRPEMAHFRAWSQGGSNSADNIIPLCRDHHEKFDKQNQSGRVAVVLAALLDRSTRVPKDTVSRVRNSVLSLPSQASFDDLRKEIWQIKATGRLGSSLLVEEADLLCKMGQPSEAWETLRILFHYFVTPSDNMEVSRGLAAAGEVALAYGDHQLGIALFSESGTCLKETRARSKQLLSARIRATRGIANCLLVSDPTGGRLLTLRDLDGAARDARDLEKRDPEFASGAANLEAFCVIRDAFLARLTREHRRPNLFVNRLTRLERRLRGLDPLGAAYRAVNIGQVLLLLDHFSDANDLLEHGKQRLLALGEIRNASVAGHQQVEALVRSMRASQSSASIDQALATLRRSVQLATQVSNADRYWDNMLANLRWMEENVERRGRAPIDLRSTPPFDLGILLPRSWPARSAEFRVLIGLRGGRVRMIPQANAQEMVDLRKDLELVLRAPMKPRRTR